MSAGKIPASPANSIQQFEPREHVRLRPGMYFGPTDQRGLNAWLANVIDDSIAEAVAQHCDHIWLTFKVDDEVVVRNNGRGIPLQVIPEPAWRNISTKPLTVLEHVMLKAGTYRHDGEYRVTGGLHGVHLVAVNALATHCSVEVKREGYLWRQEYREGIAQTDVLQVRLLGIDECNGTTISLQPDFTIFEPNAFVYETWAERFRELACLLPRVTFSIRDDRTGQTDDFYFSEGLGAYLMHLNRDRTAIHVPLLGSSKATITPHNRLTYTIRADVAIQFNDTDETAIVGYLNTEPLPSGLHMDIALETIRSVINNDWFPWTNLSLDHVKQGLTVVIHVFHPAPHFQGNLRYHLVNADVCGVVVEAISAALTYRQDYRDEIEAKLRANGAPFDNKYEKK